MRCFRAYAADLRRDGGFRRHQRSDPVPVSAPKHGLPSHDAFSWLLHAMDPGPFAAALSRFASGREKAPEADGKTLLPSRLEALASASRGSCFRSSANRFRNKAAIAYPLDTQLSVADCGSKAP